MTTQKVKFEVFQAVPPKIIRFGAGNHATRESIYPVGDLEVGTAFFVKALPKQDGTLEDLSKMAKRIQSSVTRFAKRLNIRLSVRALPESDDAEVNPFGDAGVGVFRVAGEYNHKPKNAGLPKAA